MTVDVTVEFEEAPLWLRSRRFAAFAAWDGMTGMGWDEQTTCDVLPRFASEVWRQIAVAFGNPPPSFEDEVRTASRV